MKLLLLYFRRNASKIMITSIALLILSFVGFWSGYKVHLLFNSLAFEFSDDFEKTLPISLKQHLVAHNLFMLLLFILYVSIILIFNFFSPFYISTFVYIINSLLLFTFHQSRLIFNNSKRVKIFTLLSLIGLFILVEVQSFMYPLV